MCDEIYRGEEEPADNRGRNIQPIKKWDLAFQKDANIVNEAANREGLDEVEL